MDDAPQLPDSSPADQPSPFATNRRRFLALSGLAASAVAVGAGATGCGTAKTGSGGTSGGRQGAAGDTLFVAGFQWGPPTSFNPLSASPAWPTANRQSQFIYETLLRFNLLDGSMSPGLGTELKESGKTLTVPLQNGAKWSDGTEITADDVVFTFQIAKDNALNYSNVWDYLAKVEATDAHTVVFTAKSDPLNTLVIKDALANTYILPKHIWSDIASAKKLLSDTNLKPVGSGPFKLDKYDQTQVNLTRDDNYWGKAVFGAAPMTTINHPIFKSNQDGDLKLASGEIDASQQFTSQIWKMWQQQNKPVATWLKDKPYYVPGNLPMLIFNLNKKGLDNVKVRQAIAYSIDYANIAATAMSSYSDTAQASLVVPSGYEKPFFDQAGVQSDGWSHDPDKAKSILEDDLKAKKGSDGIYVLPDGTKLGGWKLITPTGWSDWNTACEIVAKSAQAVGIGIQTSFPQAPQMIQTMQNGDFELAMYSFSGVSPSSPWSRFRDALDSRGVPKAGSTAYYNYGRFSDDKVAGLLDKAGAATDDNTRKEAYVELDKIFRANIPSIPLMYRPLEFYEFNSSNWDNFPTSENSYAPPMWQGAGIEWLYKIKKKGS